MISEFDASEFVDDDLHASKAGDATPSRPKTSTAPSREEVESKVTEMQKRLSELKKAQQDLENERASLEETRRRQTEFAAGRQEMMEHLTRGVGLLGEAEFTSRRETEQLAGQLTELREALEKIQAIREETWTKDQLGVELARACTTIENARMEWNSARLKFALLNGPSHEQNPASQTGGGSLNQLIQNQNYSELCKLGLALTWPLALIGLALLLIVLLRAA